MPRLTDGALLQRLSIESELQALHKSGVQRSRRYDAIRDTRINLAISSKVKPLATSSSAWVSRIDSAFCGLFGKSCANPAVAGKAVDAGAADALSL